MQLRCEPTLVVSWLLDYGHPTVSIPSPRLRANSILHCDLVILSHCHALAAYHHYELGSAAVQIAIVLASAAIIICHRGVRCSPQVLAWSESDLQ